MSKLSRAFLRIFGSSAGTDQIAEFGTFAAGTPATTTNPETAQDTDEWLEGWFSAFVGGNSPTAEDLNAIPFVLSYQLAYILENGIPEWNTDTTYYVGSMARAPGGATVYASLVNNNTGNAVTDFTKWFPYQANPSIVNTSINITMDPGIGMLRCNSAGGDINVVLPAIADVPIGTKIIIKDIGSGAFGTIVSGNGAELIDGNNTYPPVLSDYQSLQVISNGTSWDVI